MKRALPCRELSPLVSLTLNQDVTNEALAQSFLTPVAVPLVVAVAAVVMVVAATATGDG
jgi:hypothetical protein